MIKLNIVLDSNYVMPSEYLAGILNETEVLEKSFKDNVLTNVTYSIPENSYCVVYTPKIVIPSRVVIAKKQINEKVLIYSIDRGVSYYVSNNDLVYLPKRLKNKKLSDARKHLVDLLTNIQETILVLDAHKYLLK